MLLEKFIKMFQNQFCLIKNIKILSNLGLDLKLYKPIEKVKKNKIIISLRSSLNPKRKFDIN